jgi:hypothetical protein
MEVRFAARQDRDTPHLRNAATPPPDFRTFFSGCACMLRRRCSGMWCETAKIECHFSMKVSLLDLFRCIYAEHLLLYEVQCLPDRTEQNRESSEKNVWHFIGIIGIIGIIGTQ